MLTDLFGFQLVTKTAMIYVCFEPTTFLAGIVTALFVTGRISFGSAKTLLYRVGNSLKDALVSHFYSKRPDFRSLRCKQIEMYEPNSVVRVLALSTDCSFTEVQGMAHMANEMYDMINDEDYSRVIEETTRRAKNMFDEHTSISYSEALKLLAPRINAWLHDTRIELEYIDSFGNICNKLWVGKQNNLSFPSSTSAFDSDIPKLGSAVLSVTFLAAAPGNDDDRSQTSGYFDNLDHNARPSNTDEDEDEESDGDDSSEGDSDDDSSDNDSDYVPSPEADDQNEEEEEGEDESDPFATELVSIIHPVTPPVPVVPSQPSPFTFFDFAIFGRNIKTSEEEEVIAPKIDEEESTVCDEDENETDNEEQKEDNPTTTVTTDQTTTTTPLLYDEDGKGDEDEDEVVFEVDVTAVCRSWMEDKKRTSEMRSIMPFILRDAIDCGALLVLDVEVLVSIKLALRYTDGSEVILEIDRKGWVTKKEKMKDE